MNTNEVPETCPSVGLLLTAYMNTNAKSPSALSRKMDMSLVNIINIRKKSSVQLSLLWKISNIYHHNFIADIAAQLPADYTGALQNALAQKDKEISAIREKLAAMTKERDIYRDLLKN